MYLLASNEEKIGYTRPAQFVFQAVAGLKTGCGSFAIDECLPVITADSGAH